VEILREALHFLKNCGLITITPVSKEIENVSVRHPLIYMQMIKEIFGEDMPIEPAYLRLLPRFLNQILPKT
jgi:hypothetical protein